MAQTGSPTTITLHAAWKSLKAEVNRTERAYDSARERYQGTEPEVEQVYLADYLNALRNCDKSFHAGIQSR